MLGMLAWRSDMELARGIEFGGQTVREWAGRGRAGPGSDFPTLPYRGYCLESFHRSMIDLARLFLYTMDKCSPIWA